MQIELIRTIVISFLLWPLTLFATEPQPPDYQKQIEPIFTKYCNGCHDAKEANGELVLENFTRLMRGGENGPVIVPGKAETSRLILLLEKKAEPFMPPEGNKGPNQKEISVLKTWIKAGAKGPQAGTAPQPLVIGTQFDASFNSSAQEAARSSHASDSLASPRLTTRDESTAG